MQTLTERVFKLSPPYGLFDRTVIHNLFPRETAGAIKLLVYRAVNNGEIVRLKPGVYLPAKEFRKENPHPFVLSSVLHFPSHVSLESSLAFYGIIPEAVFSVSCVSPQRSRSYKTPEGLFSFLRVSCKNPADGVKAVKLDKNGWAFIAEPVRAIADMIFVHKEITWKKDGLGYLTESLRIDPEDLAAMDRYSLDEILKGLSCRRTRTYLQHFEKEVMV